MTDHLDLISRERVKHLLNVEQEVYSMREKITEVNRIIMCGFNLW